MGFEHDIRIFAENANGMRESLGMTIAQLGDASGVPHSAMSQILKGRRNITVRTASDIAKALGVPLASLFSKEFHEGMSARFNRQESENV